jgi:hypothetical protein
MRQFFDQYLKRQTWFVIVAVWNNLLILFRESTQQKKYFINKFLSGWMA